jgi:hypothetical protein
MELIIIIIIIIIITFKLVSVITSQHRPCRKYRFLQFLNCV